MICEGELPVSLLLHIQPIHRTVTATSSPRLEDLAASVEAVAGPKAVDVEFEVRRDFGWMHSCERQWG